MARGPALSALLLLSPLLALGACVPLPAEGPEAPLFAILCTEAGGGEPVTTMVAARAITVTSGAQGAELGWAAAQPGGAPGRLQVAPGQRCTIYRRF